MAAISPITIAATVPDLWDKAVEALKEKDKQNIDFQRADRRVISGRARGGPKDEADVYQSTAEVQEKQWRVCPSIRRL